MKKILAIVFGLSILGLGSPLQCEDIDVFIKGIDDGKRSTKQQDYQEALMNAKLQAVERAGIEITSITKIENFQLKQDMIESKAKGILLPGFKVMDMGYQSNGLYTVILSGKVRTQIEDSDKFLNAVLLEMRKIKHSSMIGISLGISYRDYQKGLSGLSLAVEEYKKSPNATPEITQKMIIILIKYYGGMIELRGALDGLEGYNKKFYTTCEEASKKIDELEQMIADKKNIKKQ